MKNTVLVTFIAFLLCTACNNRSIPNVAKEKLSAKTDSTARVIADKKSKVYAALQSEDDKHMISCSKKDSDAINKRIGQLRDSIYECKIEEQQLDMLWINNK